MAFHIDKELRELFVDLHESGIFSDGKAISDLELKESPEIISEQYKRQKNIDGFSLKSFTNKYFQPAKSLAIAFESDTNRSIQDHLETLWNVLKRDADSSKSISTLLGLPFPYIVPGGRFNEIYYWDSYFTMLGLEVSKEYSTILHMVDNFAHMIDQYGFIPNGNRSYFLSRSQPPFFSLMIELANGFTEENLFLKYKKQLFKEYSFWMKGGRRVELDDAVLNKYHDNLDTPRIEMYSDDIELIEREKERSKEILLNIRAACESGWDFSSRWLTDPFNLESIETSNLIQVDLNCLLYHVETSLEIAFEESGDYESAEEFGKLATRRAELVNKYFWDEDFYYDYDFKNQRTTGRKTLAALYPLYFKIANPAQAESVARIVEEDFLKDGGLITSTIHSGQQWDAPNGWAPLQWISYKALKNYSYTNLANEVKSRWMSLNEKVYHNTGKMMEKYNVVDVDLESGGGEYPVQDGFGWTNNLLINFSMTRKSSFKFAPGIS